MTREDGLVDNVKASSISKAPSLENDFKSHLDCLSLKPLFHLQKLHVFGVLGSRNILRQDGGHHFHIHLHHVQLTVQLANLLRATQSPVSMQNHFAGRENAFVKFNIVKSVSINIDTFTHFANVSSVT